MEAKLEVIVYKMLGTESNYDIGYLINDTQFLTSTYEMIKTLPYKHKVVSSTGYNTVKRVKCLKDIAIYDDEFEVHTFQKGKTYVLKSRSDSGYILVGDDMSSVSVEYTDAVNLLFQHLT